jgi:hypothetical protein
VRDPASDAGRILALAKPRLAAPKRRRMSRVGLHYTPDRRKNLGSIASARRLRLAPQK